MVRAILPHAPGEPAIRASRLLDGVSLEPRDHAGALATLRTEDDEILHVRVLPGARADRFDAFPGVLVVSPRSPLGRAPAGLEPGGPVTIRRGGREVETKVGPVRRPPRRGPRQGTLHTQVNGETKVK